MSTPDPSLRQILETVAKTWEGTITGVMKSASGEVLMRWKWDREKKMPVKMEG